MAPRTRTWETLKPGISRYPAKIISNAAVPRQVLLTEERDGTWVRVSPVQPVRNL